MRSNRMKAGVETLKNPAPVLASFFAYDDFIVGEHPERMQRYVEILLGHCDGEWNLSAHEKDKIILASILHDAGKSVVPAEILTKPSGLTEEEFDKIKLHTIAAADVFARASVVCEEIGIEKSYLTLAEEVALHHHEKWDGTGYPMRLKGEEIPFPARVIAIADVYDALTSRRPYKRPWGHEEAYRFIVDDSGQHFDPALVEVFKSCAHLFNSVSEDE